MAWVLAKHQVTDRGIQFEFHGDQVDPQGRPSQVAVAFVLFDDAPVTPVKDPDPAVLQAAMQAAAAQILATVGNGTAVSVAPKLGARLKAYFTGSTQQA